MRGARERHECAVRCDGRRWRERRCAPEAYGEVVWFGRRGAGVKSFEKRKLLGGDGGKRAVLRGEHEVSRKAIAQGRPGCSRCTCMLVCIFLMRKQHTRPRVRRAPGLPCALRLERGRTKMQTSDAMRREIAASYSVVIPAKAGIQYPAAYPFNHWRLWDTGSSACADDDS